MGALETAQHFIYMYVISLTKPTSLTHSPQHAGLLLL
jgi:hypothetical protein